MHLCAQEKDIHIFNMFIKEAECLRCCDIKHVLMQLSKCFLGLYIRYEGRGRS